MRFIPAISLVLAVSLMQAQPPAAQPPQPKAPQIPIQQFKLDNGLRIVMSEDHSAPTYAISVTYNVGCYLNDGFDDATFFLSQHRKLNCDVILITQHPEQCDKALRRLAQPDDVARMVEYLLGDGGRNVTGAVLTIDAGNTA